MIEKLVPFCNIKERSKVECPDTFPDKVGNKCYKQCQNNLLEFTLEKNGKIY
jgi:hypothetical protein